MIRARVILTIGAVLAAASAVAMVNIVETSQVTLRVGSTNKATHPTMDACKADALARIKVEAETRTSGKATYLCRDERYQFVATFSPSPPPPPPTCPPPPASSTRTQQCPAGTTGTWTQTSASTVGPPPACTVSTNWAPSSPPAGSCTATSPPPPPPPSGDTIRNGQLFTIAGSGFGLKLTAPPLVFDDFESGSGQLQNKAAVVGTWGSGEWSSSVTYSSTQPQQGSQVAKHTFANGIYNASLYADRTTSTAYLDFWIRAVPRGNYTRNWKAWRLYGANDATVANEFVSCDSPGSVGMAGGPDDWIRREPRDRSGKWEHYRVVVKGGPGGVFSQHRDGLPDTVGTRSASATAMGIRIGHYWALDGDANCGPNPGADVYTDLVYIDTSLARVYLADAPSLAMARHTAIQMPTAWADGAVTIKANTHGFKVGEPAHLIVVTAANAERPSQRVTVGQ